MLIWQEFSHHNVSSTVLCGSDSATNGLSLHTRAFSVVQRVPVWTRMFSNIVFETILLLSWFGKGLRGDKGCVFTNLCA